TTFCALIRSLQSGDVTPIIGRKTLGAPDDPEADLLFVGGNRRLQNGNWSQTFPAISATLWSRMTLPLGCAKNACERPYRSAPYPLQSWKIVAKVPYMF